MNGLVVQVESPENVCITLPRRLQSRSPQQHLPTLCLLCGSRPRKASLPPKPSLFVPSEFVRNQNLARTRLATEQILLITAPLSPSSCRILNFEPALEMLPAFDKCDTRPAHIDAVLNGLDRYNPETTTVFQDYVAQQCEDRTFDVYATLALLKLYVPPVPKPLASENIVM